jgi:hypothetical protein
MAWISHGYPLPPDPRMLLGELQWPPLKELPPRTVSYDMGSSMDEQGRAPLLPRAARGEGR